MGKTLNIGPLHDTSKTPPDFPPHTTQNTEKGEKNDAIRHPLHL